MPVSPEDRASPFYVEGVACPHCHDGRDEAQRARYRDRHRQIEAALTRGEGQIGISPGTQAESRDELSSRRGRDLGRYMHARARTTVGDGEGVPVPRDPAGPRTIQTTQY